jgi:hypothetical protein
VASLSRTKIAIGWRTALQQENVGYPLRRVCCRTDGLRHCAQHAVASMERKLVIRVDVQVQWAAVRNHVLATIHRAGGRSDES